VQARKYRRMITMLSDVLFVYLFNLLYPSYVKMPIKLPKVREDMLYYLIIYLDEIKTGYYNFRSDRRANIIA